MCSGHQNNFLIDVEQCVQVTIIIVFPIDGFIDLNMHIYKLLCVAS